jgi:DNA repair protein RadC
MTSSKEAFNHIQASLSDLGHEEFMVLFLNRQMKLMSHEILSRGGVAGTVSDVRIILKSAIERLASYIIVAHNHPSGNLNASQADIDLTKKLNAACSLMDIHLRDHLIIGDNRYFSFADNDML